MPKLYFRYGAMGSAKSLNLLAVAHNYRKQGKKVFLLQPTTGAREPGWITTRAGLKQKADHSAGTDHYVGGPYDVDCVLVDEAQFLQPAQVEELRVVAKLECPVICYGLLRDFSTRLFPGSKRLVELADSIEEIKTTCQFCQKKATQNLRLSGGTDQVQVGDSEYAPTCFGCYSCRYEDWLT